MSIFSISDTIFSVSLRIRPLGVSMLIVKYRTSVFGNISTFSRPTTGRDRLRINSKVIIKTVIILGVRCPKR